MTPQERQIIEQAHETRERRSQERTLLRAQIRRLRDAGRTHEQIAADTFVARLWAAVGGGRSHAALMTYVGDVCRQSAETPAEAAGLRTEASAG